MNIRLRLTLWYTAILLLILIVFGVAVYIGLSRSLMASLENHLQREAAQVIGEIRFRASEENESHDDEEHERQVSFEDGAYRTYFNGTEIGLNYVPEEGVYWRVLDTEGQTIFDPGHFTGAALDSTILTTERVRFDYAVLANNTPIRLYTVPFVLEGQGAGIVQVAESYEQTQEVQGQLIVLLALGLPFTMLAASGGGWFLAGRALAPIDRITRSAQQISADDLHQRLNLDLPNDEVGRLAATFDQMLARLDDAFQRQKRFIADASHEMRTPLTILKGDVEVALNRPRSTQEYQETLHMVNQTTDRLTALVQELFLLARADNHQFPLQVEAIDLAQLLAEEVARLQAKAQAKNITLALQAPPSLPLVGDPDKLGRLFMNLIDNALKYSQPGDTVQVTAAMQHEQAQVTIRDSGPGIPVEHLPHLFERFYRVDKARSRQGSNDQSSGAGLGLSIAQWLAQLHGGHIEVSSEMGQGTTFTVWLPLTPSHTS